MEITEAKYLISSVSFDTCPPMDRPEVAFVGRSNVGKSSLINMLCNNARLAKTSRTPGKTQLINHFTVNYLDKQKKNRIRAYLVDLPGYGFAKVAQRDRRRWEQMCEGYIRKRANLVMLFVLLDSRHAPHAIDLEFLMKLGKWETPFTLVFTKADKNKPAAVERNINLFMAKLQETWDQPPVFFVSSAVEKTGKEEILEYIWKINKDCKQSGDHFI